MSYFKPFPFVKDYKIQDSFYTGMNITVRTGFSNIIKNDPQYYTEYTVAEGETPEILADRVYGDVDLYWVILMFNDIMDIDKDWPLDHISFENYIENEFSSTRNDIHHYESASTGAWVDSDYLEYDRIPITNYEYQITLNDAKRKIKIPVPQAVLDLKSQHKDKIRQ